MFLQNYQTVWRWSFRIKHSQKWMQRVLDFFRRWRPRLMWTMMWHEITAMTWILQRRIEILFPTPEKCQPFWREMAIEKQMSKIAGNVLGIPSNSRTIGKPRWMGELNLNDLQSTKLGMATKKHRYMLIIFNESRCVRCLNNWYQEWLHKVQIQ